MSLQRGPIVYCAEWPDNNGHVLNLVLSDIVKLKAEHRKNLLNGVTVLHGNAISLSCGKDGETIKQGHCGAGTRYVVKFSNFNW
jgi:DUF1680 family protein